MLREDLSESDYRCQEITQFQRPEEKDLGIVKWEMEECCKQREQPECWLSRGRKVFSEQKVSCPLDTGTKRVMPGIAAFYKVSLDLVLSSKATGSHQRICRRQIIDI